jgi:hypothetical protein
VPVFCKSVQPIASDQASFYFLSQPFDFKLLSQGQSC